MLILKGKASSASQNDLVPWVSAAANALLCPDFDEE